MISGFLKIVEVFDVTQVWGFGGRKGFWLSVTTLDINGDGRMDVIAGNLGRNTSWQVPDTTLPAGLWNVFQSSSDRRH